MTTHKRLPIPGAELPQMMSAVASSNTTSWTDTGLNWSVAGTSAVPHQHRIAHVAPHFGGVAWSELAKFDQRDFQIAPAVTEKPKREKQEEKVVAEESKAPSRRIVQVFVVDPDANVPLDRAVLYRGEQVFTDLSDQELFFELDIAGLLKAHNDYRTTLSDKSVKSKTVHLEPARIRDLKMTVVTLAAF